jgi:hypothetical protein
MVDSVFTRCSSASAPYDGQNPNYDVLILQLFVDRLAFCVVCIIDHLPLSECNVIFLQQ